MMKDSIEIDHSVRVTSRVIRLLRRGKSGACEVSLYARFDWTAQGWKLSLFKGYDNAECLNDPMRSISADHADLAIRALEMLQKLKGKGPDVTDTTLNVAEDR